MTRFRSLRHGRPPPNHRSPHRGHPRHRLRRVDGQSLGHSADCPACSTASSGASQREWALASPRLTMPPDRRSMAPITFSTLGDRHSSLPASPGAGFFLSPPSPAGRRRQQAAAQAKPLRRRKGGWRQSGGGGGAMAASSEWRMGEGRMRAPLATDSPWRGDPIHPLTDGRARRFDDLKGLRRTGKGRHHVA